MKGKSLKNVLIIFLILTVAGGMLFAATANDTLTLSGSVGASVSISVAGATGYDSLSLANDATEVKMLAATITEGTNKAGYTVTISSAKEGYLEHTTDGTKQQLYTAWYGTDLTWANETNNPSFILQLTPVTVTASGLIAGATKYLHISYTVGASANWIAGTYSDTLTFTIAVTD